MRSARAHAQHVGGLLTGAARAAPPANTVRTARRATDGKREPHLLRVAQDGQSQTFLGEQDLDACLRWGDARRHLCHNAGQHFVDDATAT